jgi:hypothetical protein
MLETGQRLAKQSDEAARLEAWFWLKLAQRAPWSTMKPAVAMLAMVAAERLLRHLNAAKRKAIDSRVAEAAVGPSGWIEPPPLE